MTISKSKLYYNFIRTLPFETLPISILSFSTRCRSPHTSFHEVIDFLLLPFQIVSISTLSLSKWCRSPHSPFQDVVYLRIPHFKAVSILIALSNIFHTSPCSCSSTYRNALYRLLCFPKLSLCPGSIKILMACLNITCRRNFTCLFFILRIFPFSKRLFGYSRAQTILFSTVESHVYPLSVWNFPSILYDIRRIDIT